MRAPATVPRLTVIMRRKTHQTDELTKLEAAFVADCHPSTINRRIESGELPAARRFGRWLILRADLAAMLAREATRSRKAAK